MEWNQAFKDEFGGHDYEQISWVANSKNEAIQMLGFVEPIINYGIRRLDTEIPKKQVRLSANLIIKEIIPCLLEELAFMASKVAVLELNIWRVEGQLIGDSPEDRFSYFCKQMRKPDVALSILESYPLLANQVNCFVNNWIDAFLEFLDRLNMDWDDITVRFNHPLGSVESIKVGLGDYHNFGRSVMMVSFSSGARIVYKPRSGLVDVKFHRFLDWLEEKGVAFDFKAPFVIDKKTHLWAEFIEPLTCDDQEKVKRFYKRLGGYIAILYALEATDFHFENLIACGEYPVLIDLESLFHPRMKKTSITGNSVLRTGLVPYKLWASSDREGIDISGLGGAGNQIIPIKVPTWIDKGKDTMRGAYQEVSISEKNNRPTINGQPVNPASYLNEIINGFEQVYSILLENRDELLSDHGPIDSFSDVEIRAVIRATSIYDFFLQEGSHPLKLRDEKEQNRFLDKLWLAAKNLPQLERLIPLEKEALRRWDIPLFKTKPNSTSIWDEGRNTVEHFFAESSLNAVRGKIQSLSIEDMEQQSWIIRTSFAITLKETFQLQKLDTQTLPPFYPDSFLIEARKIGDRLISLCGKYNDPVWIGIRSTPNGSWDLSPVGADLYNGMSGIALFFGALSYLTKEERYYLFTRSILNKIRAMCNHLDNIGAFNGTSGLVYVLSNLSIIWNDRELLDWANELIDQTFHLIEKDESLDWIGGAAGCISVMLGHHSIFQNNHALDFAIRCGNLLCDRAVKVERGVGWIAPNAHLLTGMAHGAAGFALSLVHLSHVTGENCFKKIALEAIEFERSKFNIDKGNWITGKESREQLYNVKWCSGAPGIGMARVLSLYFENDASFRDEIHIASQTTIREGFGKDHSLCHGDLGNLDFLLMAKKVIHDLDLTKIVTAVFQGLLKDGWSCGNSLNIETPGLMTGISGIGYGLLRLYAPNEIPSVLGLQFFETNR